MTVLYYAHTYLNLHNLVIKFRCLYCQNKDIGIKGKFFTVHSKLFLAFIQILVFGVILFFSNIISWQRAHHLLSTDHHYILCQPKNYEINNINIYKYLNLLWCSIYQTINITDSQTDSMCRKNNSLMIYDSPSLLWIVI